jgi:hypothetical protein
VPLLTEHREGALVTPGQPSSCGASATRERGHLRVGRSAVVTAVWITAWPNGRGARSRVGSSAAQIGVHGLCGPAAATGGGDAPGSGQQCCWLLKTRSRLSVGGRRWRRRRKRVQTLLRSPQAMYCPPLTHSMVLGR